MLSRRLALFVALICLSLLSIPSSLFAQAYIFATNLNNPDLVMHSSNYDGTGGVLNVTVGINPSSQFSTEMIIPTLNVISVWNGLQATTGNVRFGEIAGNQYDFESTLLHEVGHSLGLAHVNLASESGQSGANRNYSKSTEGANGVFNLNPGADGVIGSSDDIRGDDVNYNFFEKGVNNPFSLNANGIFDSTTYSNDLADLPTGDSYVANADRNVSTLFSVANTEAVMQQGAAIGETQRTLAASDVIAIRYAQSGLDEIQGTADDYILNLEYAGLTTQADIVIQSSTSVGFAASSNSVSMIGSDDDHFAITSSNIFYNPNFNWFFTPTLTVPEPSALAILGLSGVCLAFRRNRRLASKLG